MNEQPSPAVLWTVSESPPHLPSGVCTAIIFHLLPSSLHTHTHLPACGVSARMSVVPYALSQIALACTTLYSQCQSWLTARLHRPANISWPPFCRAQAELSGRAARRCSPLLAPARLTNAVIKVTNFTWLRICAAAKKINNVLG